MKEPLRLLNDTELPAALRDALAATQGTPPALTPAVHAALSGVAAKLSAASIAATASGAATGITAGVAGTGATSGLKILAVVACLGGAGAVAYVAEPVFVSTSIPHRQQPILASTSVATSIPMRRIQGPREPSRESASGTDTANADPGPRAVPLVEAATGTAAVNVNPGSEAAPLQGGVLETAARRDDAAEALGIAAEAKLLERARRHLTSDPALSLRETSQHRERFASGQMAAERELIAVEALLRLGRRSEAERRAAPQLQQDETGLYTKRLRQLLDEF